MKNGRLRGLVGGGALLLGAALVIRESGDPTVFGRYSLPFFLLIVEYLPLLFGALCFWMATDDVGVGLRRVRRSGLFWLLLALIALPAAGVGLRFARTGGTIDMVRVLGLLSLAGGYALVAISLASREASRGFRFFQRSTFVVIAGVYVAASLITPVLGGWVERNIGLPAETTFRLTRAGDYDRSLIDEPGATFVYTGAPGRVREFAVTVRNNSWGFHDRERSLDNPDGRPRIVVLGNGYVQALEVPRDSAFPALLERRLSDDLGNVEVIRLARRRTGQRHQLELLEEYGAAIAPELIILVWQTSDLLGNDPDLAAHSAWLPNAVLFPGLLIDRLVTQWLQKRAYLLGERYRLGVLRPDYWAYLEPAPPRVTVAFAKTEALLDEVVEASRTMGSDLMFVIKRPTNELRWLERFPSLRNYEFNPDAHADWLASYAKSQDVYFLDLGPPLQAHYDLFPTGHERQYSWPHAGFLREPGHKLVAEAIYESLVSSGLVDSWRPSEVKE